MQGVDVLEERQVVLMSIIPRWNEPALPSVDPSEIYEDEEEDDD